MKFLHSGKNSLVSTILNIIGLTFAFAALYIIIVQVHYDLTYNHGIKDSDRIYLFVAKSQFDEGKYSFWTNRPAAEYIISSLPDVEKGGTLLPNPSFDGGLLIYKDIDSDPIRIESADASLTGVEVFGHELIEGDWENWLPWESLAIPESLAKRLGVQAGDVVKVSETSFYSNPEPTDINIAVIYKDVPENSDLSLYNAIQNIGNSNIDNQSEGAYAYFVKVKPGVSENDLNSAFKNFLRQEGIKNNPEATEEEIEEEILEGDMKFVPIRKLFADPKLDSPGRKGNSATTFTLLGIAILITIIAFINYINFFFALVPIRLKDINIRKILGSSRVGLVWTLIGESVIFVLIALGLAAVLVVIFSHSPYAHIISTSVLMKYHWGMTFITIGAGIIIAIIVSLFPAIYITSFNPALALKGSMGSSNKGNAFRTGLIGFQFTISIILIICAIIVDQQRNYILNHDLGFDKSNLLTAEVTQKIASRNDFIESRLKNEATISDVTWADGPIVTNQRMGWGRYFNDIQVNMEVYPVAWNFLQFMNIPIVEGRDFVKSDEQSEGGLFIFNETARDKFNFKIGDKFTGHMDDNTPAEIIGFAKDFNYKTLNNNGGAFCFYQFGKYPWRPLKQLFVRTVPGANPIEVKERITEILKEEDPQRAPGLWDVQLFDSSIENLYQKEKNLSQLINLFTLLAIVISLMGVFGLVMFDTEHRKKEIGIRRVNGASVEEILKMFNMKFIKIVIVSFIISVPLSWWIITLYLQSYPYRTPIYIWVFLVAFLAVLIVTTGVVTIRSFRAATANPVESLRTE